MVGTYEPIDRLHKTLNRQFRDAIELLQSKKRYSSVRGYEEDFCYIIDNIERDAICNQQRHISDAKKLIEEIIQEANDVR